MLTSIAEEAQKHLNATADLLLKSYHQGVHGTLDALVENCILTQEQYNNLVLSLVEKGVDT